MICVILDAHISGPVVGKALEEEGHNVFSVDQSPELEGLSDSDLLVLARKEERVLITANVRHFLPLLTEIHSRGESHSGCILIPRSIRSENFGALVSGVRAILADTLQEEWVDRIVWVSHVEK